MEDLSIKDETWAELCKLGRMDMSFDDMVWELVQHAKQCDRWWEKRYD